MPAFLVFTDRRGIEFLLGQIISNAVKYSDCRKKQPELTISLEQLESEDVLRICDNGVGVKECDFPIFLRKVLQEIRPTQERKQRGWACISAGRWRMI